MFYLLLLACPTSDPAASGDSADDEDLLLCGYDDVIWAPAGALIQDEPPPVFTDITDENVFTDPGLPMLSILKKPLPELHPSH